MELTAGTASGTDAHKEAEPAPDVDLNVGSDALADEVPAEEISVDGMCGVY